MILDIIATVLLVIYIFAYIGTVVMKDNVNGSYIIGAMVAIVTLLLPIYCIWR